MRALIFLLRLICRFSTAHPYTVVIVCLVVAVAGFSAIPRITISTDLIAGVGKTESVIKLTRENIVLFGEQDSLILVLEFPEPPGEARRPFIIGLGEMLKQIPGIRRVVYRFVNTEDRDELRRLFGRFLLGMNRNEQEAIRSIFTPQGMKAALRRNRNRLFLTETPYLQQKILDDPLELGQFVADSMRKRLGKVSLGDPYLFLASPDATTFLIQITPDFPSGDIVRGRALVKKLEQVLPIKIESLTKSIPGAPKKFKGIKWHLTGKMVFHRETDRLFDREMIHILLASFLMVSGFLLFIYRRFTSLNVLMAPIAVSVGGNYAVMYFAYNEVNPVVLGSTGILFGLGTDFGVHLWGRLREVINQGIPPEKAIQLVFERTGPPVVMGALTSVIAFLCLCLSDQPAMGQFGFLCASGVLIALTASLFLFPALAQLLSRRKHDAFPLMRVSFKPLSGLFTRRPGTIAVSFAAILILACILSFKITYEKDLYKVFLARNLDSMAVAELISSRFKSNFSQPTFLSFDVDSVEEGVRIQWLLDGVLEKTMVSEGLIATFDSVSYLVAPKEIQRSNMGSLAEIAVSGKQLQRLFQEMLSDSDLSRLARSTMSESLRKTLGLFSDITETPEDGNHGIQDPERSWYQARVGDKYRFLTRIRYPDTIRDPEEVKRVDRRIVANLQDLPVKVSLSGPRQSMEVILASLVSELLRLGIFAVFFVVVFFLVIFRHPTAVGLSLVPMAGAFFVTLGIMGAAGVGIPFSIIGVAPLIFGLGIDNGIHVVMRSFKESERSIVKVMSQMTRLLVVTSVTTVLGFLSMVTSSHYSLEFLGWCMVIGMGSALVFTIVALPSMLLIIERREAPRSAPDRV